jgi:hypothetical protein
MHVAALPSLTPFLATAGIGWVYYRRIRRQFGRQAWRPGKGVWLRLALLTVLLLALGFAAFALPRGLLAIAGGMALGALLGALALWHTRIERVDGALWYTPNPWIGGALSLLLVLRLAWRWQQGVIAGAAAQQLSALTLGFAAALVAYYLINGAGLAWRMHHTAN